jgi:hypothetical protein
MLKCALAVAGDTGKAGGGEVDPMAVTCTVRSGKWECITSNPTTSTDAPQSWTLVTKKLMKPCDIGGKSAKCFLENATGSLWVLAVAIEREGLMQLRMDMDMTAQRAIGAKVCSGTLTVDE